MIIVIITILFPTLIYMHHICDQRFVLVVSDVPTATADSVVAMFLVVRGGPGDESASLDKGEYHDFTTDASTPVLIYSPQPAVVSLVTPSGHTFTAADARLFPLTHTLTRSQKTTVPVHTQTLM